MTAAARPLALVTGANRGLGLEVVQLLAARGWRVLLGARDPRAGEQAAAPLRQRGLDVEPIALDVTDAAQRQAIAARIASAGGPGLDVLVNNSGVYEGRPEHILAVNYAAPLALTDALAAHLAPGARVVMVSSGLGALSHFRPELARRLDPPGAPPTRAEIQRFVDDYLAAAGDARSGWPSPYTVSKAVLNALARRMAVELGDRVRVNAVSPGWCRTRMGGAGAPRSVDQGAASIAWAATIPADGPTGGVFEDGQPIPL